MLSLGAGLDVSESDTKGIHHGSVYPHDQVPLLRAHFRRREGHEARHDQVRQVWQDHDGVARGLISSSSLLPSIR